MSYWGLGYTNMPITDPPPPGYWLGVDSGCVASYHMPTYNPVVSPGRARWSYFPFAIFETCWAPEFGSLRNWRLPLWIPCLAFTAIFLSSYLPVRRRGQRRKRGLCVKCGYDLRGSRERCPECGARFETPKLDADC